MHVFRRLMPLAAVVVALMASETVFAAESVEALIKRQSQEFSDASASGNAAVLARYLDDHVIFMNETGEVATKKDIVDSATPTPKGQSNSLTQTDFAVEVHGTTAVTKFTDVLNEQFHGQALQIKFLSTEVWLKEGSDWRMISSQTMTQVDDPPSIVLPASVLDEYVGTYQAGSDFVYKVARSGDGITGAAGDARPVALKAELKDVMFTPGAAQKRKIFQRDSSGKVTSLVFRYAGHDIVLKRVG
jgi:ketosteroid isomerase-like protein